MDARTDVSIIIVNCNTADLLRECLNSIYVETQSVDFEVFVVDNASSDESTQIVENEFSQVYLIKNRENIGFARANNQAMELCKGRYVLLLNSDAMVVDSAIDKMTTFMDQKPNVGIATCKVLNPDGTFQISSGNLNLWVLKLLKASQGLLKPIFKKIAWLKKADPLAIMYRKSKRIKWMSGSFMMVRDEVISEVGKFDEKFFLYGEDNDWCIRIRKSGWKLWFFAGTKILHYGGESSSKVPSTKVTDWYIESQHYLLSKHFGRLRMIYWYLSSMIVALVQGGRFGFLFLLSCNSKHSSSARERFEYFRYRVKRLNAYSTELFPGRFVSSDKSEHV